MAKTLLCLGATYNKSATPVFDPIKAEHYLVRSKSQYELVEDKYGISECLTNLCQAYMFQGKLEEAFGCAKKSLAISKENEFREIEVMTLMNIANLEIRMGRFDRADTFFDDALKIAKELGNSMLVNTVVGTKEILKGMSQE